MESNSDFATSLAPLTWVIKTPQRGDTNARIGVAEHIGGRYRMIELPENLFDRKQLKDWLLNTSTLFNDGEKWPDILIGPCSHVPYMQEIKSLSGDALVVAVRSPVCDLPIQATDKEIENTDIIVSYPFHGNKGLPNLFLCNSIPNRITKNILNDAELVWRNSFSPFSTNGPTIGVIVGGNISDNNRGFSKKIATDIGRKVNRIASKMNGSLLVSMSARTPDECKDIIGAKINVPSYIYDPKITQGENPYLGILGSADFIVVTADSMSMCCEAASSGKPVYIYYDKCIVENTHSEIVHNLVSQGHARFLNDVKLLTHFSYTPKNDAERIANKVHDVLRQRKMTSSMSKNVELIEAV